MTPPVECDSFTGYKLASHWISSDFRESSGVHKLLPGYRFTFQWGIKFEVVKLFSI